MARYRVGLETRERILAAARSLLGEVGFEGTTLKAISDRAGIGAGSFYNLFRSKDDAVLEVVRQAINAVDPDPSGLGKETVADLVHAYVAFLSDDQQLARIYVRLAVTGVLTDGGLAGRVRRHHAARVERFTEALRRDRPDLEGPEAAAQAEAAVAALTGFAVHWLVDGLFDLHGQAHRLIATLTGQVPDHADAPGRP